MTTNSIVGGGGGGCFRAGTQIQLENGRTASIEDVKCGDEVVAFDEMGNLHLAKVTKHHFHEDPQPIIKVKFWSGEIFITPNHWVLNQYNGFVEIQSLVDGHDAVVSGMGHLLPIKSKRFVDVEPVYNLTVEPHHTFIADGIRVHNGGHRERFPAVVGSGGGAPKGGGGGFVEDDDTLQSKSNVKIIDLLGEGQIGGLVSGAKSIYLNDTQLMSDSGSYNFSAVSWDHREGTPNQEVISGFSSVETPHSLSGIEFLYNSPQTFTITAINTDRVRVIINLAALMVQDEKGIHGSSVAFRFEMSNSGGAFSKVGDSLTITGKTKSKYQKSYVFDLPQPSTSGWSIRVVRETEDSNTSKISNKTYIDSYVEIVDTKINYANSALVSIGLDPQVFSSIPTRSYLVKGLLIRVPSNLGDNHNYTGIWDGSFRLASSSNPAWVMFDLLTSKRYGLGNHVSDNQVDIASLYTIGKYCDELVPDGLGGGGKEARFTINTVIQTQAEAYKLISDISSTFRGMAYWNGGMVGFRQDSPSTPTMIFNQANVLKGEFAYASSSRKDRHSVVNVTWNDPLANYKQRVEYVEDHELILSMGVKTVQTVAFGCTSRGQAHRVGKWILYTEKYEANMITFKVGLDASMMLPGEVVRIHDSFKTGKRMGGRIVSSTLTSVTVDSEIKLSAVQVSIFIAMPDGSFAERPIRQSGGLFTTLTWDENLSELPVNNAVFVLSDDVVPMLARVLAVTQDGKFPDVFSVIATEHNPEKYAGVEDGVLIRQPTTTTKLPYVTILSDLCLYESTYFIAPGVIGSKLHISWVGQASLFKMLYRITPNGEVGTGAGNWVTVETKNPSYDIEGLYKDNIVDVTVSGLNLVGNWTAPIVATITILGKSQPPKPVATFKATSLIRSIRLNWTYPADMDVDFDHVEITWSKTDSTEVNSVFLSAVKADSYLVTGLTFSSADFYFWIKTVDTTGNKSITSMYATSKTLDEAGEMVATLEGKISASSLNTKLGTRINLIDADSTGLIHLVGDATARIGETEIAAAGVAQSIKQLTTTSGEHSATLEIAAESIDGIKSSYAIKIDQDGYVSGYGIMSELDVVTQTPQSTFAVRADMFSIGTPAIPGSTGGPTCPFMVTTTTQTIDGKVLPPGVYMKKAFITHISADQIDTRGLTIKDSTGKVILGSGTGLDWTNIDNAPSSYPLNATDAANLNNSTNPEWLTQTIKPNLGGYAFLDQINSANIGTFIDDAAIGTAFIADACITAAKIGDLAVNTLHIGKDAVTIAGFVQVYGVGVQATLHIWLEKNTRILIKGSSQALINHNGWGGTSATPWGGVRGNQEQYMAIYLDDKVIKQGRIFGGNDVGAGVCATMMVAVVVDRTGWFVVKTIIDGLSFSESSIEVVGVRT